MQNLNDHVVNFFYLALISQLVVYLISYGFCSLGKFVKLGNADCAFGFWNWRTTPKAHNYYVSEYLSSHRHKHCR